MRLGAIAALMRGGVAALALCLLCGGALGERALPGNGPIEFSDGGFGETALPCGLSDGGETALPEYVEGEDAGEGGGACPGKKEQDKRKKPSKKGKKGGRSGGTAKTLKTLCAHSENFVAVWTQCLSGTAALEAFAPGAEFYREEYPGGSLPSCDLPS
jgi:hypothetical protein